MRVKKYQAKNMAEAMKMVKADLGPNAIILHSRDTGKGIWGLFSGRGVEVTAAVDAREPRPSPLPKKSPALPTLDPLPPPSPVAGNRIDFKVDDSPKPVEDNPLLALSRQILEEKKQIKKDPDPAPKPLQTGEEQVKPAQKQKTENPVELRLSHLENQLERLTNLLENMAPRLISGDASAVPHRTRELYNHLLEQDVDETLALHIATHLAETTDEGDDVWTALKSYLSSQIPVARMSELEAAAKHPRIIMLVGPTGVGKTTTLAKISALYRYARQGQFRPKIVFITADLYRLAAVEQLQKYVEILGSDLEVTYSPEEVQDAIRKHKDAHLILCDTAGTCQRNLPQMSTLASICAAASPTEVHLVLSATTKFSDMVDIVDHFKEVSPDRLIFTKIDESTTYGPILNTVTKYRIPISYLTIGQNVPEDIEVARAERIARLLLTKPTVNRIIANTSEQNPYPETPPGQTTSDTSIKTEDQKSIQDEKHDESNS
ncbi:MAG: flagellar biosynthesis protein FlhF [bacterium]